MITLNEALKACESGRFTVCYTRDGSAYTTRTLTREGAGRLAGALSEDPRQVVTGITEGDVAVKATEQADNIESWR